ncbi:serine/threonine protein kinase [Mycolicibacterium sp. PAM1]|uniref:serine/threonine-protein kinase n=1 Tax=Mycolicibacterium sp. PAM1 TaxID=2853535 RepID=UPI000C1B188E|nr:serine/threonine-protein kinase [Mycolicibacterium sp. PAM1]MBV5246213.1 serine/threonine protein kinase [Mycolicibacterium sp. PAM1]
MPLAAGETFAGYTIVRLLGSGGMGEVYLAQHPRLPRRDALKVLPAAVSADVEYRKRFEREADIAATLWHPHIVGVHDRGEDAGRIWISMDYVEGADAAHLLAEDYRTGLPVAEVAQIVTAVADALDYAHDRHLLHRDVKPANILIARPDSNTRRIMLADFGIARWDNDISGLTATNMTVGTVSYAAPEQLMGQDLDGRADQYALAATAFHLLTGSPPFSHSNPAVVISRHLNSAPATVAAHRPELAAVDPALTRALAKNPADRYPRCADFARELNARLDAGAPAHTSRIRPAVLIPVALAVLLVAAVAVAAFEVLRADPADRADPPPMARTTTITTAPTTSATTATPPATPASVVIGANCAPLDATATTGDGTTAYCAAAPGSAGTIWSLTQGTLPTPTSTPPPDPTEQPLSDAEAFPVLTCMEQTGQTRRECRRAIRESNGQPPLP